MTVSSYILIHSTAQTVWQAISDIPNLPKLIPSIQQLNLLASNKPAHANISSNELVGTSWQETRLYFGKPASINKTIIAAEPLKGYTTQSEADGFIFLTTLSITLQNNLVCLTSIHQTQAKNLVAKLKMLPMVLFKGMIKKAILADLVHIKQGLE